MYYQIKLISSYLTIALNERTSEFEAELIIPILGILTGMVVPIAVFIWLYKENKGKRDTILEISKNIEDPAQLEKLLTIFDDRKKEPIDYRRNGVVTIFVGFGLYLLGFLALGSVLEGVGGLVTLIGIGTLIAGYLYPNTGSELTNAVEEFEKQ
ncbi:MAG: DUF6249 domain-containing protein [Flavicella sp.]